MAINSYISFRNELLRDSKVDKHDCLRLHVQTKEQCWIKNLIFQVVLGDTPTQKLTNSKGNVDSGTHDMKISILRNRYLNQLIILRPQSKKILSDMDV